MVLAIAAESSSAYSETFVQMQFERLPCSFRIHGKPVANETIPGGPIAPLRCLRGIIDTAVECGLKGRKWEGPQSKELSRRLKRAKVDTVLANFGDLSNALLPVCRECDIKLVAHFHGYDAHMNSMVKAHGSGYSELGKHAAAVVVVSEHMSKALLAFGIPKEKLHVVRCGANARFLTAKTTFPTSPMFFGVGRFVDKKAPYLTLLAFKAVRDQFPDARLVLGGGGPLLEATRNICSALGLDGSVTFPGILSPAEVADWMQRSTAFVQHSITPRYGPYEGDSEGTPVTILEAMLMGLPVISTRHAGICEVIVSEETGLLVEERDTDGMAHAMITLSQDPSKASQLGAAARKIALIHHTEDVYISALKQILAAVRT